jgi:hypothetical protein
MWTIELVKARFFEACDVERRMVLKGAPGGGNGWPAYVYDHEDRAGWDDQARQDALEVWQGRKITKSPELSRWEEVFFEWTHLIPESRRLLIWRWAQCIASGRSFSKYCEKKGLVRATAYNRMEKVFENLTARFVLEARYLRWPDPQWHLQPEAISPLIWHQIDDAVTKSKRPIHPPFRTQKHQDMLTTPAAVAAFSQHLAESNERRRKARLRKALRGVPGEQEAA